MCLNALRERCEGDAPPRTSVAWKLVDMHFEPLFRPSPWGPRYIPGTTVRVDPGRIWEQRRLRYVPSGAENDPGVAPSGLWVTAKGVYHYGLHVYQSYAHALRERMPFGGRARLLAMRVRPEDWIADDGYVAVYTRVHVLAEVTNDVPHGPPRRRAPYFLDKHLNQGWNPFT